MIPPDIIERIRDTVPLAEFIGRDLVLKKAGSIHKGLCPFHNERTPSFAVYADKNRYYCFGCGKKGDIFTYVQERDRLTFMEAARFLAEYAGIQLPETSARETAETLLQRRIVELNDKALAMYRHALKVLPAGRPAIQYLIGRGLSAETIDAFRIGYALPQWDALSAKLQAEKYEPATLVEAGLARPAKDGRRIYDYFRDRIMFPINNERGQLVAFGGRVLDKSEPKYLNSPESPVFRKRELLFGLDGARQSIAKEDLAVIVEGYMDVIGLWQAGITNVVAPLGTALTNAHLERLKRHTTHLVFLFDGDKAGRRAAFAAARPALELGFGVRVVLLSGDRDAFDLGLSADEKEIRQLFRLGIPLSDFVLNTLFMNSEAAGSDRPMIFLQDVYEFLDGMDEQVQVALFLQKAALLVGADVAEVELDFRRRHARGPVKKSVPEQSAGAKFAPDTVFDQDGDFEFYLLRLVCLHPTCWPALQEAFAAGLRLEDARAHFLMETVSRLAAGKPAWTAGDCIAALPEGELRGILEEDAAGGRLEMDWEKQVSDTIDMVMVRSVRRERTMLDDEMRRQKLTGGEELVRKLQQDILALRKREEALMRKLRGQK